MISFQEIISKVQDFWDKQGCAILQSYDMEMGAGTFHPATMLSVIGRHKANAAFVQVSRRPGDARYGENPNRLGRYHQFQVLMKPSPSNIRELYLQSLECLGIKKDLHDIRFVEDNWESPTLGAAGLGWEVWCDGMEVSQFTYFQQFAGISCDPVTVEITYGLERLAMYIQKVDNVFDVAWNDRNSVYPVTYGDVNKKAENELSKYIFENSNKEILMNDFNNAVSECKRLIQAMLVIPAYEFCIKASHIFNLLDASKSIGVHARSEYIDSIRDLVKTCVTLLMSQEERPGLLGSMPLDT